ncbi:hypothetical protein ACIBF5_22325 [Micromonospora sp. NPDC050417]|uniref:hypothetical protein n=1 Tax=Micromonospora sp. NPDC050417 TaxID=3364280 RepID=UPI0037B4E6DF
MTGPTTPPSGPAWVQILLTTVGLVGATGGVAAVATIALRRRRFRTDAAEMLTDTALTIVGPLRGRVTELELETAEFRGRALAAEREISELRLHHRNLSALLRRWRAAIMAPDATIGTIRDHVRAVRSVRPDEYRPRSTPDA